MTWIIKNWASEEFRKAFSLPPEPREEIMKESRPFSLADAKAGAPYACRDGREATVLKWDRNTPRYVLLGVYGDADDHATWNVEGFYSIGDKSNRDLVMLPLGEIDGRPVFVGDKLEMHGTAGWTPYVAYPTNRDFSDSRWPAPAKQYPFSQMSEQELLNAAGSAMPLDWANGFLRVAHAAIRHAIDHEQVITAEMHQQKIDNITQSLQFTGFPINNWQENIDGFGIIKGNKEVVQAVKKSIDSRSARDMAIARAVAKEVAPDLAVLDGYLAAIIEGVK